LKLRKSNFLKFYEEIEELLLFGLSIKQKYQIKSREKMQGKAERGMRR